MDRFDKILEKDIEGYEGEHSDLVRYAPAFYRLMSRMLGDPELPRHMWKLVIAAIAYFILPSDIIPEESHGAEGYVDDIFLCAVVADQVRTATGSDEILLRNWDGDEPIVPLVRDILNRERELIGDKKEALMSYIGYEELVNASQ
ncbi:MAG: DUF1232 domain-containing protein [Methanothrix sp.]